MTDVEHSVPVLVVGGGPVGLLTAWQLAENGIDCMLAEQNETTTRWPKMDITNCRSMELLARMSLGKVVRDAGVSQDYSLDTLFSTGLGNEGEVIEKWSLLSPNDWTAKIQATNNGSMPREPYQRCSQAIFEASLKPLIDAHPRIKVCFGLKFESLEENELEVTSKLVDVASGQTHLVKSQYIVGCDGANSAVRRDVGINVVKHPLPAKCHLVHFKSRDLTTLHRHGQFWHIYFTSGAVVISQDEVDTWTIHVPFPLDADTSGLDAKALVSQGLGGIFGPVPIEIDEVLLHNSWYPTLAIADAYRTANGRVFLAGDSVHQNVPTGGYGMNTGVGDAFDIGWKLAAVLNGYGGKKLLNSYEVERRPVGVKNVERSGIHASVHKQYAVWTAERGPSVFLSDAEQGKLLRAKIAELVLNNDGENTSHGIEMDYRFPDSPVIVKDHESNEDMAWDHRHYTPSTVPGSRAPHVFLRDGTTSIFDFYGKGYTIVDFTLEGTLSSRFMEAAVGLGIPLVRVHLPDESHVHTVWQCDVGLIRPDGFVSWRGQGQDDIYAVTEQQIKETLQIATGQEF